MRKMKKEKCSCCLNIDLAFSLPHKHTLRCQCLCSFMSFTLSVVALHKPWHVMRSDASSSKTCNVKGYQTNSLKQMQSWHGDSTELVPHTRPPAEHFHYGISEEHCQILVFPNTRQPPSLRP